MRNKKMMDEEASNAADVREKKSGQEAHFLHQQKSAFPSLLHEMKATGIGVIREYLQM